MVANQLLLYLFCRSYTFTFSRNRFEQKLIHYRIFLIWNPKVHWNNFNWNDGVLITLLCVQYYLKTSSNRKLLKYKLKAYKLEFQLKWSLSFVFTTNNCFYNIVKLLIQNKNSFVAFYYSLNVQANVNWCILGGWEGHWTGYIQNISCI